jgi:hypothetical protein
MTYYRWTQSYKEMVSLSVPKLDNPDRLLSRSSLRNSILLAPGVLIDLTESMAKDSQLQELIKNNFLVKADVI